MSSAHIQVVGREPDAVTPAAFLKIVMTIFFLFFLSSLSPFCAVLAVNARV